MSHEIGDEKFMARLAAAAAPVEIAHQIRGQLVIESPGQKRVSTVIAVLGFDERRTLAAVVELHTMTKVEPDAIDALYAGTAHLAFDRAIVPFNVVDGISWEQMLDEALTQDGWTTQWGAAAPELPPLAVAELEATIARLSAELDAANQAGAALAAENRALCALVGAEARTVEVVQEGEVMEAGARLRSDLEKRAHAILVARGYQPLPSIAAALTEGYDAGYRHGLADAQRRHETALSIQKWQLATFGPGTMLGYARRALEELQTELIPLLEANDMDGRAIAEIADVVILLSHIAAAHNVEIAAAVDAKMAINRARRWRMTGGGHGQHIEDGGGTP